MNAHRLHATSKRRRTVYLRKVVLVFTACIFVLGFGIFFGISSADAHDSSDEEPVMHKCYTSIEITSGDTLWGIAEQYMDENYDSIYDYIHELKEINGLVSDDIQSEQYLTVAYYEMEL